MGVIYKMLARNEGLNKPKHRNLFVDMEENIHIHYRDLRIELSRKEFEDFASTFKTQSAELLEIIKERKYEDGVLPNTNTKSVTIWTDSRLPNPVKYHPQRLSLEECSDGYHLHLRNYKLLLDRDDFTTLMTAFKTINLDSPYAGTPHEIAELLDANHVHYAWTDPNASTQLDSQQYGQFVVAQYHEIKIRGIFTGIGMIREIQDKIHHYTKEGLILDISLSENTALFADKARPQGNTMILLTEYLARERPLDPDLLNAIKARVLDTFSLVRNSETPTLINLDYRSWVYDAAASEVIFPFSAKPSSTEPLTLYRQWNTYLKELDMYFVKPTKVLVDEKRQKIVKDAMYHRIKAEVADIEAVSKVYVMGSVTRAQIGTYTSPFIHSEWAKLGSDADILMEIDEGADVNIPESWNYVNFSPTKKCDIYHIGQVEAVDVFGQRKRYPNIEFFQHLLDAYLYFPSRGDEKLKDEFLTKFKAELIYDRDNGGGYPEIHGALIGEFGASVKGLKRMDVATENQLYEVDVDGQACVLKVYKVSGNYSSSRLGEHARYEAAVIRGVEKRGVATASVLQTLDGDSVFNVGSAPAILFRKLTGKEGREPDYPLTESVAALVKYHAAQKADPMDIKTKFSFKQVFDMWHKEYHRFAGEYAGDEDIAKYFSCLELVYNELEKTFAKLTSKKGLLNLHNHGDVTPRNVIVDGEDIYLFDFQNAFYGPRVFDVVDGGIEFSWGSKNPDFTDFSRYDQFVSAYVKKARLPAAEKKALVEALKIIGIIKFVKEVRMIKGSKNKNNLRRRRALDLAAFLESQLL